MHYRREIDGLRAVAVVPVILFHAGFAGFRGGYVGVDVFFVISGYLITSILIAEIEAGDFSILRFYERRARRILPALYTVMAACIPLAWIWMLPNRFQDFSQSLIATVFFGSNILFWREFGYFAPEGNVKPLLHTWSLSVEEQYYLLFPLMLLALWRFGRTRVFWVIVAIAALSLLVSEWGWRNAPTANFFLTPPRAWELLAGSICAFLMVGRAPRSSNPLSMAGLGMIVGAIFVFDESTPFPSVYALVPVIGTALVVYFGGAGTHVARVLSSRPLVGIGLISYSAYLWHQPLFAFARLSGGSDPDKAVMAALSVLTLGLAWMTWYFVEQPFRRPRGPLPATRRQVFAASGGVALIFVAIGVAGHVSDGFANRLTAEERAVLEYADYPRAEYYREGRCMLTTEQVFSDFDESCWGNARQFIIGDSHAAALASGIRPDLEIGQLTAASCPPVLDFPVFRLPSCVGINEFRINAIAAARADVVYIHADWFQYWRRPGFQEQFGKTLARISEIGPKMIIIGSMPKFYPNLPELVLQNRIDLRAGSVVGADLDDLRDIDAGLRQMASRHGATFWDPIAEFCSGTDCLAIVPRQATDFKPLDVALFSWDHAHLTFSGAVVVADRFFGALER